MFFQWFSRRADFQRAIEQLEPARRVIETDLAGRRALRGYCCACEQVVNFKIARVRGQWTNLREAISCPQCRLNGRMRMIVGALAQMPELRIKHLHVMERLTPLYFHLAKLYRVTGSEFVGPNAHPGSFHIVANNPVRHENFLELSFPGASFDVLFHGDVQEHLPDSRRAFREAARVLAPGGQMIFTTPFFNRDNNVIRARIENGELVHLEPPAYHGNPMCPEKGSLVFTDHGWQMIEDLRSAGFSSVETGLCYDPFQGIVSDNHPCPEFHTWPLIFRARR